MTAPVYYPGSEILQKYQQLAGREVFAAIKSASSTTGVDFTYLLEQAQAESNFDADVKAKTSSATGLFQFIDKTWLEMVAKHGYKHGLGRYGQEISFDPDSKRISVSSNAMKREILALRKDPEIAAKMAAEFAKENQDYLEKKTDAAIGSTEMYLAHFLGAGSAAKFINHLEENGSRQAAKLFPDAARANRPVFYNDNGAPKSLKQVYAFFDKKFSDIQVAPQNQPTPAEIIPMALPADHQFAENTMPGRISGDSGFMSDGGLYQTISELDIRLLSDMIRQWTQEDESRAYSAYQNRGSFA